MRRLDAATRTKLPPGLSCCDSPFGTSITRTALPLESRR